MPPKKGANAAAKGAPGSGRKKDGNDKDNPPWDSALPLPLKDTNSEFWPKVQAWVDAMTKNEILGDLQNADPLEVVQGGRLATRCVVRICEFRFECILN